MYNILLIDDEDSIVLALSMALEHYGFNVEIATNGTEGIEKFDEGQFDLVITDVRMPGLNGNAVAHHIHNSKRPFAPIIGISGTPWDFKDDVFDAVLSKPFSINALVDTVTDLTTRPLKSMAG